YRALAVDRARALYELEVRTTLGESMARLTEAQWRFAQTEFDTALVWAQLSALTGAANPWLDGGAGR
ncbi:MAG: TolC family protein, partial [Gammaproteobacteria bacterium]|nr:TolC family protein [Gammaproteobacteria bacterium]